MNSNPWTLPIQQRLMELRAQDPPVAFRTIAKMLNAEFNLQLTTNACIGRAFKLRQPVPKPRPPTLGIDAPIQPDTRPRKNGAGLDIYQLRHDDCRWPLGAGPPPYRYCGRKALEGLPYCTAHSARAYNRPHKAWE
jgi:hypothetical protein